MEKLIKLQKVHHELIWGTEDWIIGAHQNGNCIVSGGTYSGIELSELYKNNREIFGNHPSEVFPLLVKIIDAKTPLSIQVHPGDEYAKKYEDSLGKTECWYILDCEEDSDIIIGQKAKSKEEFQTAIDEKKVMDIMDLFPIKKGDFFHIPAGTVHAIRSNTKILEIQQSSDITYRLYDYNRTDANGNTRELHIDKSLDVINYDFKYSKQNNEEVNNGNYTEVNLVEDRYFVVNKIKTTGDCQYENNYPFLLGVVISGEVTINDHLISTNESFIIPANFDLDISGDSEIMLSYAPII